TQRVHLKELMDAIFNSAENNTSSESNEHCDNEKNSANSLEHQVERINSPVSSLSGPSKEKQDLFKKHFAAIQKWHDETIQLAKKIYSDTHRLNVSISRIPSKFNSAVWGTPVEDDPFPFKGKVVFLVNSETACAAEDCVVFPMEYQELRTKGTL